jgi:hypothetical protein
MRAFNLSSVTQEWVQTLPGKMQSTLVLGLRGPDTHYLPNVKKLGRWLRGLVLIPSDPDNLQFMLSGDPGRIDEKSDLAHELEFCSVHFYTHLMHTFQIVGHKHPDPTKRNQAYLLYADMCRLLHVPCETSISFENRLDHKQWPSGQPQNMDEVEEIKDRVIEALKAPKRYAYGGSHG